MHASNSDPQPATCKIQNHETACGKALVMPCIVIRRSLVFLSDMLILQPWKFEERRSTPLLFRLTMISKRDFRKPAKPSLKLPAFLVLATVGSLLQIHVIREENTFL
jgi:hypothetical protein